MSGLDEQFENIPRCPLCSVDSKLGFWILAPSSILSRWAWLVTDDYLRLDKKSSYERLTIIWTDETIFDEIVTVRCRPIEREGIGIGEQHTFKSNTEIFKRVMNVVEFYRNRKDTKIKKI